MCKIIELFDMKQTCNWIYLLLRFSPLALLRSNNFINWSILDRIITNNSIYSHMFQINYRYWIELWPIIRCILTCFRSINRIMDRIRRVPDRAPSQQLVRAPVRASLHPAHQARLRLSSVQRQQRDRQAAHAMRLPGVYFILFFSGNLFRCVFQVR